MQIPRCFVYLLKIIFECYGNVYNLTMANWPRVIGMFGLNFMQTAGSLSGFHTILDNSQQSNDLLDLIYLDFETQTLFCWQIT